ncbi:MAG: erythromycin esterase family protein [Aeromicrobium erythreum]
MSSSTHPRPATGLFTVAPWRPGESGSDPFTDLPSDVTVVGLGESAHFVAELNQVRVDVATRLLQRGEASHVALEIGPDEEPLVQGWLRHERDEPLVDLVGPLTWSLYGTFLTGLRDGLAPGRAPVVLGVDLPNALTPAASLDPLAELVDRVDPDAAALVDRARGLGSGVVGGSAAASAIAWTGLEPSVQDALTVSLARLVGRLEAIGPVLGAGDQDWERAVDLARAARTTDLMLRAMTELFAGEGLPADTTLRERHVADRLLAAERRLAPGERILYVAHDNHVQRAPVVFGGDVAAYPVGQALDVALGTRYRAVGLTHLDASVPEMVVPAPTPVGFRVERVPAPGVEAGGVEAAAATVDADVRLVRPRTGLPSGRVTTIRSQSVVTEVPVGAFDAVLVTSTATTDPAAESLTA